MLRWTVTLAALAASLAGSIRQEPAPFHVYSVDQHASRLFVVTHKAGLFAFLGHEHAILPMAWRAHLCLDDPIPAGAHGTLLVVVDSLIIDSDSARALAGLAGRPSTREQRQVQRKMLDRAHLDATGFPEIRLDLRTTRPSANGRVTVEGSLSLHGFTRHVTLPVSVKQGEHGNLFLSGTLRIGQRDFGIQPESVAGVVKVANDVDLHFLLSARPTTDVCPGPPAPSSS